jgi:hypothetical protein
MQVFIRNVIGIVLMVGLTFVVGCASTQSGSKMAMPNPFPWSKTEQRPEKAGEESLSDVLGKDRVTTMVTR